jgi:uncharacterized membrane protein
MEASLALVLNTVLLRPYVFAFLLVYLLGCSLHLGVKRAVIFCVAGYLIAWLSEYSSIHNGIPYGHYYYIERTRDKELWVLGVPLMDSLSYVFLAYASYSMAIMIISPLLRVGRTVYILETKKIRNSLTTTALGAILFVYLDIIIDPVALLGDKWFLGQIYGYPDGGIYFGVPISNFLGWLIVGFLLIYALQKIDGLLHMRPDWSGGRYRWRYLIGPALYCAVIIFNLCVTFYIHEYNLAWVGIFIVVLPLTVLYYLLKIKLYPRDFSNALKAHISDFPQATIPGYTKREAHILDDGSVNHVRTVDLK